MKKLIIALAAVILAGSPALAKKYYKHAATDTDVQAYDQADPAYRSFAYVPGPGYQPRLGYSTSVYAFGQYQGADPDPFIRQQLLRDPPNLQ